jgi:hypothetical protein
MQCSKNIDIYIDMRLKKWGAWCERIMTGSIGYPSSSAFTKIGEARNFKAVSVDLINSDDEELEETEEAVKQLHKHKKKLADIIRINYVSGGKLKEKCLKCNISYDSFKKNLAIARAFMAGFIMRKGR